jgi:hypothetical protein
MVGLLFVFLRGHEQSSKTFIQANFDWINLRTGQTGKLKKQKKKKKQIDINY